MNTINLKTKSRKADVKPGAIFTDKDDRNAVHILAQISPEKFCCVSLIDGNRWTEPRNNIPDAISGLELMAHNADIAITEIL